MGFSFLFFILLTEIIQVFGDNLTWGQGKMWGFVIKRAAGGNLDCGAGFKSKPQLTSQPAQTSGVHFRPKPQASVGMTVTAVTSATRPDGLRLRPWLRFLFCPPPAQGGRRHNSPLGCRREVKPTNRLTARRLITPAEPCNATELNKKFKKINKNI